MSDGLIQRTLDAHLAAFSWTDPITGEIVDASDIGFVQWSGIRFKPNIRQSYLRPTFPGSKRTTHFQGDPILSHMFGGYEIQAWRPEQFGEIAAKDLADAIARHFFPGTGANLYLATPDDEFIVQIENDPQTQRIPTSPEGGFEGASCRVNYFAQIPRTTT